MADGLSSALLNKYINSNVKLLLNVPEMYKVFHREHPPVVPIILCMLP